MQPLIKAKQLDKDSIENAFNLNKRTEKIITFIFPSLVEGAFGPICKFPLAGKIKRIDAYCETVASVDTIFTIETSTQTCITKFTLDEQNFQQALSSSKNTHTEIKDNTKTQCTDNITTSISISPWKNILSSNIIIPKNQNFQNNAYIIANDKVLENTIFRINFLDVGLKNSKTMQTTASNLTIQIIIETDDNY